MSRIVSVELLHVDLPPPVPRSDAIQSFVTQETLFVRITCEDGSLGAGKTVFVKGLASALGIDPEEVTSPSFTLVNPYSARLRLFHIDLYRLEEGAAAAHAVSNPSDDQARRCVTVANPSAPRIYESVALSRTSAGFRAKASARAINTAAAADGASSS